VRPSTALRLRLTLHDAAEVPPERRRADDLFEAQPGGARELSR